MTLGEKLKALFGSLKFWLATSVFITAVLEALVSGAFTLPYLFDIGQTWLAVVTGIGIFDGGMERLGGSKRRIEK